MINFDPKEHRYTDDEGREYLSVTQLLERMFPFDRDEIAAKVSANPNSRYFGMPTQDILAEWSAAADKGTEVHEAIETWIKDGRTPKDPALVPMVEQFAKLPLGDDVLSEERVWDESLRIAGTVDLIERQAGECVIWDIKTSKRIEGDTHLKYSMQLEIYRQMVEKRLGQPARIGGIVWFEDYVRRGIKTQLQVVPHLACQEHVAALLRERRMEIST